MKSARMLSRIAHGGTTYLQNGSINVLAKGFVGGYELDLLLMAISISLLLTGPGRISVEWNVLKRELFPFDYYEFTSPLYFSDATFYGLVSFRNAKLYYQARFIDTKFFKVNFGGATLSRLTNFGLAMFYESAYF